MLELSAIKINERKKSIHKIAFYQPDALAKLFDSLHKITQYTY